MSTALLLTLAVAVYAVVLSVLRGVGQWLERHGLGRGHDWHTW